MKGYFTERSYKGDLPYTDLALERHRADLSIPGVGYTKVKTPTGFCERIKISTKSGAESIGRPIGLYDTLTMRRMDLMAPDEIELAKEAVAAELCQMLEDSDIFPGRLVVAGLGNPHLTIDSIGCAAAKKVKPTMHIKEIDEIAFAKLGCAEIVVVSPGVRSISGIDAAVLIKGLCDLIRPDAVIAIDALCSSSIKRLGKTIQICNSGISPGSGIGNERIAIGVESLGVPVIAIGLPTVIDTRSLCNTATASNEPMTVAPREIGEIIEVAAEIISDGINRAFGIYP